MSSPSGPGSLHQRIDSILTADQAQRIHLIPPGMIRIGEILPFRPFLVIVKIKHQEPAGSIRQKGIYSNHIRPVLPVSI